MSYIRFRLSPGYLYSILSLLIKVFRPLGLQELLHKTAIDSYQQETDL